MAVYITEGIEVNINRAGCLVDSNLLIAAFGSEVDDQYRGAKAKLEEGLGYIYVLDAVVVESWGFLVGRNGDLNAGYEMLRWVGNTTNATVLPSFHFQLEEARTLVRKHRIDMVDALLLYVASDISKSIGGSEAFVIATYDTQDFLEAFDAAGISYSLFDLKSDDLVAWTT